ncbi:MAG: hypothetical protein ACTSYU_04155 [Promethearchaeota archaeon]
MMGIKSLFFLPHGMQIIPGLETPYNNKFSSLNIAMLEIQKKINTENPDLILLFKPHGNLLDSAFGLYYSKSYRAYLPLLDRSNVDGSVVHSIEEYTTNWSFLIKVLKTTKNTQIPNLIWNP